MKNAIEKQLRYNLPEGIYHIHTSESKSSTYFYVGTEKQLDMYEKGYQFADGELKKFRVSDHDAMCTNSWSHEEVILNYFHGHGYVANFQGEEIESNDTNVIAKEIARYFASKF